MIFDVDGTLVDTNYLHAVTWWQAFRQYGRTVPMADVHRTVGMGSDNLVGHLLPADRDTSDDDAIRSAHRALYAQYWERLVPFDGAAALLERCASRGRTVVLASSAADTEMRALRAALDADDAISVATSSSDVERSKPAPDLVQAALKAAGVRPEQAVFVGDTVWDVKACEAAGVACVGVLTGGLPENDLREAGAVAVYESVGAILRDFDGSPLA